jgi:hypothetical protein
MTAHPLEICYSQEKARDGHYSDSLINNLI